MVFMQLSSICGVESIEYFFTVLPKTQILQNACKMVNLVNTLSWLRAMLNVNGQSHVIHHVLTLRNFGALKKLHFWQNCEEVLNQLNSASELRCTKATCRGHGVRSHAEVLCRGMQVARSDLHLWIDRVIIVRILWVKRKCQLVVRLKANKCYQELLCYLSSYKLLVLDPCSGFWPLRRYY